ncbi:MAG: 5'/3'-nucleotidase SurE [Chloroflexi bacterium]|nr:5'/3'-nucleotidase SurE [Ardenticatenaceae bacterium]MBL1128196.1 5'/3'-nucleotidase SurE [Chloroflexota bacterium]NOG34269.1 5'/3'-nucleotidase SurE [Chloroflexota bacterium]GIK56383.1 MAG: 5'-nucleotidase SurE [Chloroflexota bacterium]
MHILVTNDDGVTAPGLLALAQGMRRLGKVSILAPDHDWSGGGHVKTLNRPLRVRRVKLADGSPAFTSDGAPSDCVALALMGLLNEKIDLVVSGVNTSANLGHDVTYSGTVTAVMEGIIWGVPGVAVSLDGRGVSSWELDYSMAVEVACQVVQTVVEKRLPDRTFLNVNVPNLPVGELRGVQMTRQGLRVYRDRLDKRQDPRGNDYYWIGGDRPTGVPKEGTDVGALAQGYASVTPLQLDLTAYHALSVLADWEWPAPAVSALETGLSEEPGGSNGRLPIEPVPLEVMAA